MSRLRIDLTITSQSAVSVGAGGSAGTIADKSIVRDGWGRPLIPGSQVKGKARWAVEQLLRALGDDVAAPFDGDLELRGGLVRDLFGSPERRSPLHFADLPTVLFPPRDAHEVRQELGQVRPSVALNRRRGTAEDQRLLFQEIALEGTVFSAESAVVGDLSHLDTPERYAALLWAGLRLSDRWGGAKSRGLGWAAVQMKVCLDQQELGDQELRAALVELLSQKEGA